MRAKTSIREKTNGRERDSEGQYDGQGQDPALWEVQCEDQDEREGRGKLAVRERGAGRHLRELAEWAGRGCPGTSGWAEPAGREQGPEGGGGGSAAKAAGLGGAGGMDALLGPDELLRVFSFLEAPDLLSASQVDKVWNEVSRTKELWRQLCLRHWSSCKASEVVLGTQTWKQYYLCWSELEFRMESGQPGKDFICRAIAGHAGQIEELAYVTTSEYRFDRREKSVVCTVSSDCTVRAWDLHEGTEIWSSPLQPAALVNLVTYPQLQLIVTMDKQGLIKVWKTENGWEGASFCLSTFSSAMEACDIQRVPSCW
ncbi:F-box/WD repeat-containing protein 12-like [Cynocephalus volans]|uniref:F-box/WD repeat-containing protein 12-like n=1 Tax=Cynocephalus volans TaxID=110931 RepID=UPI002FC930C4